MIYRTERCNARASGDRSLSFFPVKGALTHHCPEGAAVVCLWQRALSEGDVAFCGKRQTMPWHLRVLLSLSVHRVSALRSTQSSYPMPALTCQRQLYRSYGRRLLSVHFLFRKRNKNKGTQRYERFVQSFVKSCIKGMI